MSSILPKNELENLNFCPSLLGQKIFVRFLGELKKPKSPFEINWPLEHSIESCDHSTIENTISLCKEIKVKDCHCQLGTNYTLCKTLFL